MSRLRVLGPSVVVALAAHAVVYRTLWPSGSAHSYFGWYQPVVGAVSALALVGLAALLTLALTGRPLARRLLHGVSRGSRRPPLALAHRLAVTSLAVLLLQETVESSAAAGRFVAGGFSGGSILLVVAVVWISTLALVLSARAVAALARRICSAPPRRRGAVPVLHPTRPVFLRRSHPLADSRGLRAPPLLPA